MIKIDEKKVKELLKIGLQEDVKSGDITSSIMIDKNLKIHANLIIREPGVIAGLDILRLFLKYTNKSIKFEACAKDGDFIKAAKGKNAKIIAKVYGNARDILKVERIALNIISHLSGVATLTYQFVKGTKGFKTKIVDTRKTTIGLRYFEKYAVRVAGGYNHRMGLYDQVLIKDNHIKASGLTPAECVQLARKKTKKNIEVEIKKVGQLLNAIKAGPDIIMLDNMSVKQIKEAVLLKDKFYKSNGNHKKIAIEVSGNVKLSNIRKLAVCKVDLISIGALTHSNPSLNMALKII
jgi:nicotinate-nucleotide pyrophosphorylase (carboxylating)